MCRKGANNIIGDKSTDHAKPHFDLFFTTISTSKEVFFSEREMKKALHDTLMRAVWYGLLSTTAISQSDCKISSNCGKIFSSYRVLCRYNFSCIASFLNKRVRQQKIHFGGLVHFGLISTPPPPPYKILVTGLLQ